MNMTISRASIENAEEILELQKAAYRSEAALYNNYEIPPLTQTLDEIRGQFVDHIFLKAVSEGRIIGTVRAYENNGTCYIGRLAVHPDMQNRGVGAALMREIEVYFKTDRFELFTGTRSTRNIHLYQKLGYSVFKSGKSGCGVVEIFHMEKRRTT